MDTGWKPGGSRVHGGTIAKSPCCLPAGVLSAGGTLIQPSLKRGVHPHPSPPPEGEGTWGREKDFAVVLGGSPGPFNCALSFHVPFPSRKRIGRGRSPVDLQTAQMQGFHPHPSPPPEGRGFGAVRRTLRLPWVRSRVEAGWKPGGIDIGGVHRIMLGSAHKARQGGIVSKQGDCKVQENPSMVRPFGKLRTHHQRILPACPSTGSGLTARALARLCNRPGQQEPGGAPGERLPWAHRKGCRAWSGSHDSDSPHASFLRTIGAFTRERRGKEHANPLGRRLMRGISPPP